jgi:diguanylate cyclase (GGDEF)-like protein
MDIVFPEGDYAGTDAIAEFAQTSGLHVPVVFLSSRYDLLARLHAVRAGGAAYFTKPVDVSALVDKLDSMTSGVAPEPYRVLIVEDSPALSAFYAFTLQQAGMVVQVVNEPLNLLESLNDFTPELILMDMYMPEVNGLELARVIRQDAAFVSVPIVFLSGEQDLDKQFEAINLGVDDFLTKPIQPQHLILSAKSRIERYRMLRSYMVRDSLTGLLNHTKTKEQLDIEFTRAVRHNRPMAFVMVDLDHFKSVNDTYGHPTGDRVIKSLSRLLRQRLRQSDLVGRFGGEEFAVILTETDSATAVNLMDEIREAFARIRQQSDDKEFSVTFSCGIATYPGTVNSASELNSLADKALYEAKHGGRNRVVLG